MRNFGKRRMPGKRAASRVRRTTRKAGQRMRQGAEKTREQAKSFGESMGSRIDSGIDYLSGKPTLEALAKNFNLNIDDIILGENRAAEIALRLLPATAAVGSVVGVGNLLFGGESFGNVAMDSLGMGVGAYGINRGINSLGGTTPAGAALRYTTGAVAGKMGSDLLQLLIGGGEQQQPIIINQGGNY